MKRVARLINADSDGSCDCSIVAAATLSVEWPNIKSRRYNRNDQKWERGSDVEEEWATLLWLHLPCAIAGPCLDFVT
jgi:hypothetical protein